MYPFHEQTRQIACDYIFWRVLKAGYHPILLIKANQVDLCKNSQSKLFLQIRLIAYEFETRYNDVYLPMCDLFNFNDTNCRGTFLEIVNHLFSEHSENNNYQQNCGSGYFSELPHHNQNQFYESEKNSTDMCNWGRILAIISFAGCMAIKCCEDQVSNQVESIIDWLYYFLNEDARVCKWMSKEENWVIKVSY